MFCLYVQAPFAVFRNFTAGSFRPTAPFMTPSAAYGLLLNLAGIEMRVDDGKSPMTLISKELPKAEIALGALQMPERHSIYQQLHNYPVGSTRKEHKERTKGNKYNITPVRRAFLSDLRGYICLRGNETLAEQIRFGLAGEGSHRYGLAFLGDNNFLPDRIEEKINLEPVRWWVAVSPTDEPGLGSILARFTITIDRADMSRTQTKLFRLDPAMTTAIPETAWVTVDYV